MTHLSHPSFLSSLNLIINVCIITYVCCTVMSLIISCKGTFITSHSLTSCLYHFWCICVHTSYSHCCVINFCCVYFYHHPLTHIFIMIVVTNLCWPTNITTRNVLQPLLIVDHSYWCMFMCVFTSWLPMCSLQDYPWSLSELLSGAAVLNFVSVSNTRSCDMSCDNMDSQCKSHATQVAILPLCLWLHSAVWMCKLFKHSIHESVSTLNQEHSNSKLQVPKDPFRLGYLTQSYLKL